MKLDPMQFGLVGLVLAGVFVLLGRWISHQRAVEKDRTGVLRDAEKERTAAVTAGMTSIANSINAHSAADIQSHKEMWAGIEGVRTEIVAIKTQLDMTGVVQKAIEENSGVHDAPASEDWSPPTRVTPLGGYAIQKRKPTRGQ